MLEHNVIGVERNQINIAKSRLRQCSQNVKFRESLRVGAKYNRKVKITFSMDSARGSRAK